MEKDLQNNLQFLSGGGEMGTLTRAKNWSETAIGEVSGWPQSLRTSLSIILNSKFPMLLLWGEDHICFYNDAVRPSLGENGKHPSILGAKAIDAWSETWNFMNPLIDKVLAGEAVYFEDQLVPIYRNGAIEDVYWTFCYSPVNDESGKPAGVFVTCTETTDKVVTLRELNESKKRLQFAVDAAELATWDYDPITGKFTGNDRLKSWFGLQSEDEIDLSEAMAKIVDNDRQRVTDAIEIALQFSSGGNYAIEYTIFNSLTEKEMVVQAKGKAQFDENNVVSRFDGTLQDVTEQVNARKKVEGSERDMRLLIMQAPVAICILRGKNNIFEKVNPLMANMLGRDATEVEGRSIFDAMPELKNQGLEETLLTIFETGNSFISEGQWFELPREHGLEVHYITYIYEALKTVDDKIDGIMVVAIDVTEKKLFQKKLEDLVDERTKELQHTNGDLEKMNKELQSFTYISSHDLQEPLRKIQTFSNLILDSEHNKLSEKGQHYFSRIQLAAQRMQVLIDDLLAYSRTNKKEGKFIETNVSEIIAEIKGDLEEELEVRKAVIKEKGNCKINIIPFQFRQLMQNLISNAMKFSKPGQSPIVKIESEFGLGSDFANDTLKPEMRYCHISVSDNGIGFLPEFNEKIFELFQRLHSKDQYMGTGIGLAIVKKIVENHNGTITAEGKLGKGARFDIYIPSEQ